MFDFLKKTHKITYASVSFDGTRPYNEDSLKILDTDRRKLFILADGLGGCGDGKLASQTAVDSAEDTGRESTGSGETFLKELFETAQESVTEKKENPEKGMATTMVVLDIEGKTAQWAHVGDSRLYFFRKNRFEAHTKDLTVRPYSFTDVFNKLQRISVSYIARKVKCVGKDIIRLCSVFKQIFSEQRTEKI